MMILLYSAGLLAAGGIGYSVARYRYRKYLDRALSIHKAARVVTNAAEPCKEMPIRSYVNTLALDSLKKVL